MTSVVRVDGAPAHVGVLWADAGAARACPRGDIDLAYCESCGYLANVAFEPLRVTYERGYDNALDFSAVFQTYASALADDLIARHRLRGRAVVEIGCGHGDFLRLLHDRGVGRCTGFDPSAPGGGAGVTLVRDVYGEAHRDVPADLIVCRQVFEHIGDPRGFLAEVRRTIGARDIPVFFEVPNVRNIVAELSIWDIIYEHCSYFGVESLAYAFAAEGFAVDATELLFEDQFIGVHAHPVPAATPPATDTTALTALVRAFGDSFRGRVQGWNRRLDEMRRDDRSAVVWGAGARGTSFVNMLDAGDRIRYLVDINPRKHGCYVPGTGQEIVAPERLRAIRPDLVVVMNPIYLEEIRRSVRDLGLEAEVLAA